MMLVGNCLIGTEDRFGKLGLDLLEIWHFTFVSNWIRDIDFKTNRWHRIMIQIFLSLTPIDFELEGQEIG